MMRGNHLLRHLAVAASLLQPALPLPQVGITVAAAPIAWVTVDASGSAQTVTPAVITTEGHLATVSNAPATLVSTATYTLSPSGRASTYTGLAPVASATGTGGSLAGVFPACDGNANVGPIEPFCLPKAGSELHPGTTYYITWSPSYFSPPSLPLTLLVNYSSPAGTGFSSTPVPASKGFYAWTVPADFLTSRAGNPTRFAINFALEYDDGATVEDGDVSVRIGPGVFITPAPAEVSTPSGDTTNAVAIAVPVVVVAVLVLLGAVCVVTWRKRGRVPVFGSEGVVGKRMSGAGYGVRKSRSERVGPSLPGGVAAWGADNKSETNVGVELTDRDSWSPTGRGAAAAREGAGRNVFREEVERQARMG